MVLHGKNFIGETLSSEGNKIYHAYNPATGEKLSGEVKKYKVGGFADTATFNDQLLMSCPTKYWKFSKM